MQVDNRTNQATPTIRALEDEEKPGKVLRDSDGVVWGEKTGQSNEETVPIKESKKR